MDVVAVGVLLEELARELGRAVERGVEAGQPVRLLLRRVARAHVVDGDLGEQLVPHVLGCRHGVRRRRRRSWRGSGA